MMRRFLLSRNGVDLSLFRQLRLQERQRNRRKLMFTARPERGLDVLLRDIMPRLLERDSEFQLYLAGYEHDVPTLGGFYGECDRLVARLGDRVVRLGALRKAELYEHFLSAGVFLYPDTVTNAAHVS